MSNENIVVPFQNFKAIDGSWERWCCFKDLEIAKKYAGDEEFFKEHGVVPNGEIGYTEAWEKNRGALERDGWIEGYCDGHLESIGPIEPIEPRRTESKG